MILQIDFTVRPRAHGSRGFAQLADD